MSFEQILSAPNKEWCSLHIHELFTTIPITATPVIITDTLVTTMTGPFGAPVAITLSLSKIGNIVTITIPQVFAVASAAAIITITDVLPVAYRPSINSYFTIVVQNDSQLDVGAVNIFATGQLSILVHTVPNGFTVFPNSSLNAGPVGSYISYTTV